MKCIYCESLETIVVNTRDNVTHTDIRRRRECLNCGERFTTHECCDEQSITEQT